jgi:hypothetical protein
MDQVLQLIFPGIVSLCFFATERNQSIPYGRSQQAIRFSVEIHGTLSSALPNHFSPVKVRKNNSMEARFFSVPF